MRTTGTTSTTEPSVLLGRAAAALAAGGPDALPDALGAAVAALGLRSAVLRRAGVPGELLAVAGDVVAAVPPSRSGAPLEPVVELPVRAGDALVATLTVVGAPPSSLPVLRALSAVLALALAVGPTALAGRLLEGAEADADEAADALHDGPVQELVFARLAADAAVRGGDVAQARDAVQAALQSLRRSLWMLRPRGAGDGGLLAALEQLSARLVETGRPGLELDLDPVACSLLPAPVATTAYRLVQATARAASGPTTVRADRSPAGVVVAVGPGPLPAPERWAARAAAVGAALSTDGTGSAALVVPFAPSTDPDEIEAI